MSKYIDKKLFLKFLEDSLIENQKEQDELLANAKAGKHSIDNLKEAFDECRDVAISCGLIGMLKTIEMVVLSGAFDQRPWDEVDSDINKEARA